MAVELRPSACVSPCPVPPDCFLLYYPSPCICMTDAAVARQPITELAEQQRKAVEDRNRERAEKAVQAQSEARTSTRENNRTRDRDQRSSPTS